MQGDKGGGSLGNNKSVSIDTTGLKQIKKRWFFFLYLEVQDLFLFACFEAGFSGFWATIQDQWLDRF